MRNNNQIADQMAGLPGEGRMFAEGQVGWPEEDETAEGPAASIGSVAIETDIAAIAVWIHQRIWSESHLSCLISHGTF